MARHLRIAVALVALALLLAGGSAFAQAKYHIGVVTGTVSQSEDDLRGAEQLIKEHGVGQGRRDDPAHHLSRRLHVPAGDLHLLRRLPGRRPAHEGHRHQPGHPRHHRSLQARPGQAARHPAARRRAARGSPGHRSPPPTWRSTTTSSPAATPSSGPPSSWAPRPSCTSPSPGTCPTRPWAAAGRSWKQACKDLGLKFAFETAPDPTSDVGVAGAQQFILEKVPQWIQKYGKDTRLLLHQRRPHRAAAQAAAGLRRRLRRSRPALPAHGLPRGAGHRPLGGDGQLPRHPEEGRAGGRGQGRQGPLRHLGLTATASPSPPGWASSPSAWSSGKAKKDSLQGPLRRLRQVHPGRQVERGLLHRHGHRRAGQEPRS